MGDVTRILPCGFLSLCHCIHAIILLKKNLQDEGTSRTSMNCICHSQASFQDAMVRDACARASFARMSRAAFKMKNVGNSACTPVPATRNCAVDYCIAASIGVTDIRVQWPAQPIESHLIDRGPAPARKLNTNCVHASYWHNCISNAAALYCFSFYVIGAHLFCRHC